MSTSMPTTIEIDLPAVRADGYTTARNAGARTSDLSFITGAVYAVLTAPEPMRRAQLTAAIAGACEGATEPGRAVGEAYTSSVLPAFPRVPLREAERLVRAWWEGAATAAEERDSEPAPAPAPTEPEPADVPAPEAGDLDAASLAAAGQAIAGTTSDDEPAANADDGAQREAMRNAARESALAEAPADVPNPYAACTWLKLSFTRLGMTRCANQQVDVLVRDTGARDGSPAWFTAPVGWAARGADVREAIVVRIKGQPDRGLDATDEEQSLTIRERAIACADGDAVRTLSKEEIRKNKAPGAKALMRAWATDVEKLSALDAANRDACARSWWGVYSYSEADLAKARATLEMSASGKGKARKTTTTKRLLTKWAEMRALLASEAALRKKIAGTETEPGLALESPLRGLYPVPISLMDEAEALLEAYETERAAQVTALANTYLAAVEQDRDSLDAGLWRRGDYPDRDAGIAAFSFTAVWKDVGNAQSVSVAQSQRQARAAQEERRQAWAEVRAGLRLQAAMLLDELTAALRPGEDGKRKVFKDTRVKKVLDWVNRLGKQDVTNDTDLARIASQIKSILAGVADYGELRSDDGYRDRVTVQLDAARESLRTLGVGDAPRRKIGKLSDE